MKTSYYIIVTRTGWHLAYRDKWVRDESKARRFKTPQAARRIKALAADTPDGTYPYSEYRNGIAEGT